VPGIATHHHEPDVGPRDQLGGDVQGVGNQRQAASLGEGPCDLGRRRTAGHADDVTVADEAGRGQADRALLTMLSRGLVLQRELEAGRAGEGAAVGTPQQALVMQGLQVASDRGRRDPELVGQAQHVDASVLDHPVEDRAHPLGLHESIVCVHCGRNEQFRAHIAHSEAA
jgi:hypothetical protein